MTNEEAIEYNKNLRMYMRLADKNQPCKFLEENYIALDLAIKALEQEPFINKSCVSSGICEYDKNKVLDKIRAEIEFMDFDFGDYYDHTDEIIEMVCKVIDKYKTGSEE